MEENGNKVRHGLHGGMRIYRLPPDTKWLIVDNNDGEYCASELASALGAAAVHLAIDENSETLYLHFPSFNKIARSPVVDAMREHGAPSPEVQAAIDAARKA